MSKIKRRIILGAIAFYEIIAIAVSVLVVLGNLGLRNVYDILSVGVMILSILFGVIAVVALINYYAYTKKRDNDKITQVIILSITGIIAILTLLSWFVIIRYHLL